MQTFAPIRPFVSNPDFAAQRRAALSGLAEAEIDAPIAGIIAALNRLPHCFTLQCCYGHFLYPGQADEHNLDPLPQGAEGIAQVKYRIAYVALCLDQGPAGRGLLADLGRITQLDPGNIQLCSADWFWQRQVNSFALQLEPERHKHRDTAMIPYSEAVYLEGLRKRLWAALAALLNR